ncbi:MAG: tRNA glutamyl-Q(34) synthetase GluQRS, partial [Oscillospiraceae bacterium]|nr:tRNA glutamyl-Q(34) synthetase GluQRS [Oscillospiraceae bacterium]
MHEIVGRFAPTPSGRMHLGNLFCALLAWLSVRAAGGRMILRVENLDLLRTSFDYARQMEEDLRFLGLDWDEGGSLGGSNGPYYQSERTPYYESLLERLTAKGLVYPCFCSRAQLHAAQAPHTADGEVVYSGVCRNLSPAELEVRARTRPPALRLRVPAETISLTDGHYGPYQQRLDTQCGDFILRRSDGVFAYQLAVVADDAAMGVTQVVRGRDLLPSAPRQIYLFRLLGFQPPAFVHTPLLLAHDGRRLSKRDGDLDLDGL